MQYRLYEFFRGGSLLLPTSVIGRFTKFWKKRDIFGGFLPFWLLFGSFWLFFSNPETNPCPDLGKMLQVKNHFL